MKKRFVFGNLIYYLDEENVIMMNLISFRRQKLTKKLLLGIVEIENKINNRILLTEEENKLLDELYSSKQILHKDVIAKIEQELIETSELYMDKFNVKAFTLNLTHECNFRCVYCYQNKYKDIPKYKKFMTIKDIDLIKEYLSQSCFEINEINEIILSGGESLLPQNIDTINYVLNSFQSKKFSIFTNGVNLFDYRKHINYSLIDKFQVSLDGTDDIIKSINQYSGSMIFEKIINGIKYIESLNKEISIAIMWTKELEPYIDDFIELLRRNDLIKKPNIKISISLIKNDYNYTYSIDNAFYDIDYLCNNVKKLNQKFSQIDSFIGLYGESSSLNYLIHRTINEKNNLRYKKCDVANSVPLTFEANGEIFWCLCLGHKVENKV